MSGGGGGGDRCSQWNFEGWVLKSRVKQDYLEDSFAFRKNRFLNKLFSHFLCDKKACMCLVWWGMGGWIDGVLSFSYYQRIYYEPTQLETRGQSRMFPSTEDLYWYEPIITET